MATIYTIGHSTRTEEEFLGVLKAQKIELLADIRSFPMSRRLPQFNRENLERSLKSHGIEYRWVPAMGGRRKKQSADSPNVALRNESFRNYADYMLTAEFQNAELLTSAETVRTAYMCAERMYFQCHRMLVSDYYAAHGNQVLHILDESPPRAHTQMREARVVDGRLLYIGDRLFA